MHGAAKITEQILHVLVYYLLYLLHRMTRKDIL